MKYISRYLCMAVLAGVVISCGHKKKSESPAPGSVFAVEAPADTTAYEPVARKAFSVQVPKGWKPSSTMSSQACVLYLTTAPFTTATVVTDEKLSLDALIRQHQQAGEKQRPDQEFYGRRFVVFDSITPASHLLLTVATALGDGVLILTLEAGPQKLPMEETHAALFDNMKSILENITF